MNESLLNTPSVTVANNSSELLHYFHDDDEFKYRAYTYTYLLVFPVAFICNVVALVVFLVQRGHRSSAPSVVMMNLALSDGSFSLTLPLRLAYYFRGAVWDFPDWLCRLCVFGFYLNLYTSIIFLTLLSALRWLAVSRPLRHRVLVTPTRILLVCVGVWLFVGVSSCTFLSHGVVHRAGFPRCFEPLSSPAWGRVLVLNYVALAFGFLLPFLTLLACYASIVHRLKAPFAGGHDGSRHDGGSLSSRHGGGGGSRHGGGSGSGGTSGRRSVYLLTMVVLNFLLCFLPYHVMRTLHLHAVLSRRQAGVMRALQRGTVVTLCLAASNSVVNPLLYYYSTRSFRETMRDARVSLRRRGRGLIRPAT